METTNRLEELLGGVSGFSKSLAINIAVFCPIKAKEVIDMMEKGAVDAVVFSRIVKHGEEAQERIRQSKQAGKTPLRIDTFLGVAGRKAAALQHQAKAERRQAIKERRHARLRNDRKDPSWESLLTRVQERELSEKIQAGKAASALLEAERRLSPDEQKEAERLSDEGQQAKDQLIKANIGLLISIAEKRYQHHKDKNKGVAPLPFHDVVQVGFFGLERAANKFVWKGKRFGTYAGHWIIQRIDRAVKDQRGTIRIPIYQQDQQARQNGNEDGGSPTTPTTISLNRQLSEEGDAELGDILPSDAALDPAELAVARAMASEVWENLDEDQRQILRLRLAPTTKGRMHTSREIAAELKAPQEPTRERLVEILGILREAELDG